MPHICVIARCLPPFTSAIVGFSLCSIQPYLNTQEFGNSSAHRKGAKITKRKKLGDWEDERLRFSQLPSFCFLCVSRWTITKEVYPIFQICWVTNLVNESILHVHCLVNKTLDTFIWDSLLYDFVNLEQNSPKRSLYCKQSKLYKFIFNHSL